MECWAEPGSLSQVITNLLSNAIKYNLTGGEVRVTLRKENEVVLLEVADTGPGIPAQQLPRFFERFYRADESRTGGSGGTGLGLAICIAIVEKHDGTLDVSSQPGVGTVFSVRLPQME